MLRISILKTDTAVTLKLEGALMAPWVEELNNAFDSVRSEQAVELDLLDLTYADVAGTDSLMEIVRRGARVATCSHFISALLSEAHHVSEQSSS